MVKELRGYVPLDENRRKIFLAELRRTGGNMSAAAKAASPHSQATTKSKPGFSSFRYLIANDSDFAAEVQEVLAQVRDDIFGVIWKLATQGSQDNVYQKSAQVFNRDGSPATVQKWDTKLLLRLAAKLDPSWNESKNVEHSVAPGAGAATHFATADLKYLSDGQKSSLLGILRTIKDAGQLALTHQPAEIVDIEYEEAVEPVEEEFPY